MPTSENLKNMPPPTPNRGSFMGVELNHDDCLSVCEMVGAITTLAMLSSDVLDIFVRYSPRVQTLSVDVASHDAYSHNHPNHYFYRTCLYLNKSNSLNELKDLEDKLIELVGATKDREFTVSFKTKREIVMKIQKIKQLYVQCKGACARKYYQKLRWSGINIVDAYTEIRCGFNGEKFLFWKSKKPKNEVL